MLTNILIILNQCCLSKAKKFSGHLERYCIIWGDFFLFINNLIKEFIQFRLIQRHKDILHNIKIKEKMCIGKESSSEWWYFIYGTFRCFQIFSVKGYSEAAASRKKTSSKCNKSRNNLFITINYFCICTICCLVFVTT